jgi:DNA-binding MarR family transcriptional regulator
MDENLYKKLDLMQYLIRKLHHFGGQNDGFRGEFRGDFQNGQGRILAILKMRDGISMTDLAFLLGITASSAGEFVTKLEKNGFVTRGQNPNDKRSTIINLTKKGKSIEQPQNPETHDFLSELNTVEQQYFNKILDKIISKLTFMLGYDNDEIEARMTEANRQMNELINHFHGAHGRTHHDFARHLGWHMRHGFTGGRNDDRK